MLSFIFSFEIISVAIPNTQILLLIDASVAVATAVNPNEVQTLLANGLSTFFIKGNPVFSNGPKRLRKNYPDFPILCRLSYFMIAENLFAKALQNLEIWLLVNKNLWRKLITLLASPATFDKSFKLTSVPFFLPDFNLLSHKLGSFTV